MFMIPKEEFVAILNALDNTHVSEDLCKGILETYGDEYYKDYGSAMELTVENQKRKELFGRS